MKQTNSGSKYATMAETMKSKVEILSEGIDGTVREKEIELEIQQIDNQVAQNIEEIKNTPIDAELIKKQSESNMIASKNKNKRVAEKKTDDATEMVREVERNLKQAKIELANITESTKEEEIYHNSLLDQEYERTISSLGNSTQTLNLKISKAKTDGENMKKQLQSELNSLVAKREAQKEKIDCIDKLYDDLKEISLKIGDVNK